jgi:5,10-methylenetetrahydromethanopterin reductase
LGFTHAWFFDTQMINGDCLVAMAAAALKTARIRPGPGVPVPSNRIAAPVVRTTSSEEPPCT